MNRQKRKDAPGEGGDKGMLMKAGDFLYGCYEWVKQHKKLLLKLTMAAALVFLLKNKFYDHLAPPSEVMEMLRNQEMKKVSMLYTGNN
jgi:hypothetical protein